MLKVIIGRCLIRFFTFLLLIHIIVQVSALYKCAKTGDVYSIHCAGNSWFGELFLHLPTTSKIPAPTHPAAANRRVRCKPSTTAPEYPLDTLFERSEAVTTIRSWMAKLTWTWLLHSGVTHLATTSVIWFQDLASKPLSGCWGRT